MSLLITLLNKLHQRAMTSSIRNFYSRIKSRFQEHGFLWTLRRIVRECIYPTTSYGKFLSFIALPVYFIVSKPINIILSPREKYATSDTLFYFYDFDIEPITYDFAWALCIANSKKISLGLKKIHIILVPGRVNGLRSEQPDYDEIITMEARKWRIQSIIVPIISFLDADTAFTICCSRREAQVSYLNKARHLYPARYNLSFPIPYNPNQAKFLKHRFKTLRADKQAILYVKSYFASIAKGRKIIAITLRGYAYNPTRNNNIQAWLSFAKSLDPNEYFITFLPDTERALNTASLSYSNFHVFTLGSSNIQLRHALYETAYLNLGVNTGPMSLCWLNPVCRYITFKIIPEAYPFRDQLVQVMQNRGFVIGKNAFFANKLQKWIWKDDSFDVILSEFHQMCYQIEKESSFEGNSTKKSKQPFFNQLI
jgi:hypothetical protein